MILDSASPGTWSKLVRKLLLLLTCCFPLVALTQDTPESATEAPAQTSEQQAEASEQSSNAGSENEFETPDSFEATEKVSEDYSIPFPVDI